MRRFTIRQLVTTLSAMGVIGFSTQAMASGFQLWEQSAASIGNYHAGYAAEANDATIAFFNPAGITLIKNQQVVLAGTEIIPNFRYKGTVDVSTLATPGPVSFDDVRGQGGVSSFVPALHYVAPISDCVGFGFSVDAPFGLKTNYGRTSALQYAATLSSIETVDVSPDLAFQLTRQFSFGLGFDVQHMDGEFDSTTSYANSFQDFFPINSFNTRVTNKLDDTGYGGHFGALYQFTPTTRVGMSYHTQVVHHLRGSSKFNGPLVGLVNSLSGLDPMQTEIRSDHTRVDITVPPYTALSVYSLVHPSVALMGSVIYTQWNTFRQVELRNAAGIQDGMGTTHLNVVVPENYRNTWNFSVGSDYFVTDCVTLKAGLGYDETPVRNADRNIQLPDSNRIIVALGAHYQATKTIGLDLDWSHFFMKSVTVDPSPQVTGDQTVATNGKVSGRADAVGAQVTWDIV